MLEGRIACVNHHLGDDREYVLVYAYRGKLVLERLLYHVADAALGIRAAYVERHGRDHVLCQFVPDHDVAHDRAVAVGQDNQVSSLYQGGDVRHGRAGQLQLLFDRALLLGGDYRVASESDHDRLLHAFGVHGVFPFLASSNFLHLSSLSLIVPS
jgi:hypothetical protein